MTTTPEGAEHEFDVGAAPKGFASQGGTGEMLVLRGPRPPDPAVPLPSPTPADESAGAED